MVEPALAAASGGEQAVVLLELGAIFLVLAVLGRAARRFGDQLTPLLPEAAPEPLEMVEAGSVAGPTPTTPR